MIFYILSGIIGALTAWFLFSLRIDKKDSFLTDTLMKQYKENISLTKENLNLIKENFKLSCLLLKKTGSFDIDEDKK